MSDDELKRLERKLGSDTIATSKLTSSERNRLNYLRRKARGIYAEKIANKTDEDRQREADAKYSERGIGGQRRDEIDRRRTILLAAIKRLKPVGVRQMMYYMETHHPDLVDKGSSKVQNDIDFFRENDPGFNWDWVVDGQRSVIEYTTHTSAEAALNDTAETFQLDYWHAHHTHVQVWLDKDGLAGTLEPITWEKYRVPLFGFRGMSSKSFIDKAAQRIVRNQRPCHVLIFGDLDPTGWLAANAIKRTLRERIMVRGRLPFDIDALHVEHVALNHPDQIDEFALEDAARETTVSTHSPQYFDHFGEDTLSCEIDALDPDVLRDLVDINIAEALTGKRGKKATDAAQQMLDAREEQETAEIERLREAELPEQE